MSGQLDLGPNLLLNTQTPEPRSRLLGVGAGSVAVHFVLFFLFALFLRLDSARSTDSEARPEIRKFVPLVAPPLQLTQKDPNRGKVVKEVTLDNLLAKKEVREHIPTPPVPPRKKFEAPPANPLPPAPKPIVLPPPEPKMEASVKPPQELPQSVMALPPPQIQPEEKPRLMLETPGQGGSSPLRGGTLGKSTVPIPTMSLDETIRSVVRGGGSQGGIVVGDLDQTPSLPDSLRKPPAPGRTQSAVELLSDPMGVDFRPYLIRILATVRRNWFSVMPESVHLGRRGRTVIRFIISRDGNVPKLVIWSPAGADSLDRAAVAGISASAPFPPLPGEFKGAKVELQFVFSYNQ